CTSWWRLACRPQPAKPCWVELQSSRVAACACPPAQVRAWSRGRLPATLADPDEAQTQHSAASHRGRGSALPSQLRPDQLHFTSLRSSSGTQSHRSRHSCRSQQCRGRGLEAAPGLGRRPLRPETHLRCRHQPAQLGLAVVGLRQRAVGTLRNPQRAWSVHVTARSFCECLNCRARRREIRGFRLRLVPDGQDRGGLGEQGLRGHPSDGHCCQLPPGILRGLRSFGSAVSTLVTIFSGPIFGWLSDNVSRKLVLMVRGVANTFSSILYVVAPTFAGIGVAKTLDDMGKAAFRPAWGALMAQISSFDKRNRARTMGWMSMGEDAGGVFAPMLAGFLWSTWGITALMGSRVLLAIVTEVYATLAARSPQPVKLRAHSLVKPRSVIPAEPRPIFSFRLLAEKAGWPASTSPEETKTLN